MNSVTRVLLSAVLFLWVGCKGSDQPAEPGTQGKWQLLYSSHTVYFHALNFVDADNGWIVGDSGSILRSTDGGSSWVAQSSGASASLHCVKFSDPFNGWIGGRTGLIGRSKDGGKSWAWQRPTGDSASTVMTLFFINASNGWAGDNYGRIFHTQDSGRTWAAQSSGTSWAIKAIQFLDLNEGWATATNRVVLHTINGGENWTAEILDSLNYGRGVTVVFEDIYFVNHDKGWISTTSAFSNTFAHPTPILCTTDAGTTWSLQFTPDNMSVTAISFQDERIGWASAFEGILFTGNGGANWTFQFRPANALFVDISFVDPNHGWVLSFTGDLYKYLAL